MGNLAGQQIKGYELKERIAAGGFGAVYRAYQSTVGREVAVKVILPGLANKPEFIRRFEAEAQLIARLEHMNIVPLHDYWRDPNGAYLVMRYLRGGSLRDYLHKNGAFSIEDALNLFSQVAQGLHIAHRSQVIHRDIKPGNILLDEDGNGFLADFGIAKDHTATQNITEPDSFIGSPEYLAPEQARSEAVTPQTDVYSFGVVLYEMLTGEHPFPNLEKIEVIFKHLNEPLPEIMTLDDSIRDEINTVIEKATAKDPAQRFTDVLEMLQALRNAAQLDVTATPTSLVELLTPREQEVMQLIIDGKSNREIADILVLAETTVKSYITNIYRKLKVRSRVQAIARARDLNFLIQKPNTNGSISTGHLPEPENPYKGLRAFQAADAQDYFGREKLTQKVLNRLQESSEQQRFLALVGPSGSGKSSLAKAGVIPALWRGDLPTSENWYIVDMLPGAHPIDELEVALFQIATDKAMNLREQLERDNRGLIRVADMLLPDDGSELLLVIDQFEEVFILLEDEDERLHFLNLLQAAVMDKRSRVRVLVTLRADYYDRPLQYPDFGELMRSRVETVLPLSVEELEQAIHEPAIQVGVTFEDGLISRIVNDVHYQPGALPLLQYALTELFERRDGRKLTLEAYQTIGGTGGALAKRADEIYLEGNDEAQALIRQLFLRLVTLGEGAEDTRRRVNRSELMDIASERELMDEIIDYYAVSRLLSLDNDPATRRPTVEVAHEAILREWDRLREWLNESRDDIRQERIVAQATVAWDTNNQDKSYLLRGTRLEQVEKWREMSDLTLTSLEAEFIDTSIAQSKAEGKAETERIAREKQQAQRSQILLRALVGIFALATVLSSGFGIFALDRQANFRSVALTLGAQNALNNGQADVALALAQEAINMDNPPFVAEQMFFTASSSSWIQQRFLVSDTRVFDAVYHPDGERIITTSWDGRTIVWDIETGEELQSIQREGRPAHIDIHPDGNNVAIGGIEGLLQVWNLETNEVLEQTVEGTHTAPVFTRDGTRIVTGSNGTTINIWDMDTLEIINSWEAHGGFFIPGIHFSPDESMLITSSPDGFVKIWNSESGELLQTFDFNDISSHEVNWIYDAQFLPDGERVLIDSIFEVFLWNWRSGEIIWSIEEIAHVQDIELSPDGRTFVLGLNDPYPQAHLRDIETGNLIRIYQGHSQRIQNVDFSPDGTTILTGSNDGTAIIWPVNWEGTLQTLTVPIADALVWHPLLPLLAVVTNPDFGVVDSLIRLVDTRTGEIVQEFEGHREAIRSLVFSPDGHYLLSGDFAPNEDIDDQHVYVWDIEMGEQVFVLDKHIGWIQDIAVSLDGHIAAAESEGTRIILWNLETGERIHELEGHQDWVNAVVFSPDGQHLYSGGRDGSLYQWDVETGEIVMQFAGHSSAIFRLDLNSNGIQLVSASRDQSAIVWDTSTAQALMTLQGHTNTLQDTEFSPDDRLIMTAADDGRIILWDASTGERLYTFVAMDNPLHMQATFSPDGTQIASVVNNMLTIWDVSEFPINMETWVSENRYIPDFTCEQRELYVIEPLCDEGS